MTSTTQLYFPFGRPILPRRPNISEPRPLFVLGAYPSALHVNWRPPFPFTPVMAMAVDNEPEIFWDGQNEGALVDKWQRLVNFSRSWGVIAPVGSYNGDSGRWLNENVLSPLKISRQGAWLTDCLDTYRCSPGLAKRLNDTYKPLAEKFGWTSSIIAPHPDEDAIVAEALDTHRDRLVDELASALPETVVTLGNAAFRVFRELVRNASEGMPNKLSPSSQEYGRKIKVKLGENHFADWLPLAHPEAPRPYQKAHEKWVKSMGD